ALPRRACGSSSRASPVFWCLPTPIRGRRSAISSTARCEAGRTTSASGRGRPSSAPSTVTSMSASATSSRVVTRWQAAGPTVLLRGRLCNGSHAPRSKPLSAPPWILRGSRSESRMPEIGTSGLTSGMGNGAMAIGPNLPRPSSTLPFCTFAVTAYVRFTPITAGKATRVLDPAQKLTGLTLCGAGAPPANEAQQGQKTQQGPREQEHKQMLRPDDGQGARQQLDRRDRDGKANAVDDRKGRADEMRWGIAGIERGKLRRIADDNNPPEEQEPHHGRLRQEVGERRQQAAQARRRELKERNPGAAEAPLQEPARDRTDCSGPYDEEAPQGDARCGRFRAGASLCRKIHRDEGPKGIELPHVAEIAE